MSKLYGHIQPHVDVSLQQFKASLCIQPGDNQSLYISLSLRRVKDTYKIKQVIHNYHALLFQLSEKYIHLHRGINNKFVEYDVAA